MAEIIHADHEQDGIQDAGYQYPFPQFMFFDKTVGMCVGLYGNDHFFEHAGGFRRTKLRYSVSLRS